MCVCYSRMVMIKQDIPTYPAYDQLFIKKCFEANGAPDSPIDYCMNIIINFLFILLRMKKKKKKKSFLPFIRNHLINNSKEDHFLIISWNIGRTRTQIPPIHISFPLNCSFAGDFFFWISICRWFRIWVY